MSLFASTCLVTPSYSRDVERFKLLANSCDSFCNGFAAHYVVVPKRDFSLFKPLLYEGMKLIAAEDLLSRGLIQTPLAKFWIDGKRLRPYSGWLIQQIIKLSMAEHVPEQVLVYVDSDVCFVSEFSPKHIWNGQKLRLYSAPRAPFFYTDQRYLNWYEAAAFFIKEPAESIDRGYIAQLNALHRPTLKAFLGTVKTRLQDNDWQRALLSLGDFSEFILYGVFADQACYDAIHWKTATQLCFSSWFHDLSDKESVAAFIQNVPSTAVAIHVQSNLGFDIEVYQQTVAQVQRRRIRS